MNTGYAPELSTLEKCRNLGKIIIRHIGQAEAGKLVGSLLARHGAVTPEFERELTALAREHLGDDGDLTRRYMEQRAAEIESIVDSPDISGATAEVLLDELAEIQTWLQRDGSVTTLSDSLRDVGFGSFGPL